MKELKLLFLSLLVLVTVAIFVTTRINFNVYFTQETGGLVTINIHKYQHIILEEARYRKTQDIGKTKVQPTFPIPNCKNILNNLTWGHWVKKEDMKEYSERKVQLMKEEKNIWFHLNEFWNKKGIQKNLWRPDGWCGFNVPQIKPSNSTYYVVGSWCDKYSDKPCCNDKTSGICSRVSRENCECDRCYDTRNIAHAQLSEWKTVDSRCSWHYYTNEQACDIIATSKYNYILFAGDSIIRNTYSAFMALLTGDSIRGNLPANLPEVWLKTCTGPQRDYWKKCRTPPLELNYPNAGNATVCAQHTESLLQAKRIRLSNAKVFLNSVNKLLGKDGSLIILGYAVHLGCNPQSFIARYLQPALNIIKNYYKDHKTDRRLRQWPEIIVTSAPTSGLLKPRDFIHIQGGEKCGKFNDVVKVFCDKKGIPYLNIFPFTSGVFSFDGTHFGYDVNAMKVQTLLNYVASII